MRVRFFIGFIIIAVCLTSAFAQPGKGFIIKEYNTENGLPANGIKGIAYDRKTNFLWVATEAGILRFNGQDFKTFTTRDLPALASERISKLIINTQGEIKFLDIAGNTFKIINNKPVFEKAGDETDAINYNRVITVHLSNRELIENIEKADKRNYYNIYSPIIDLGDTACLLTANWNEIFYFKSGKSYPDTLTPKASVTPMLFKVENEPFFMNDKGQIFNINTAQKTIRQITLKTTGKILPDHQIKKAFIGWDQNEKTTLLILENEAYLLSYDGWNLQARLICDQIPPTSYIRYVCYQRDTKQIFIGTQSKGIIIIRPSYFKTIKKPGNKPSIPNATYTQLEVGNREIFTNDAIVFGESSAIKPNFPITNPIGLSTYNLDDSILLFSAKHAIAQNNSVHSYNLKTAEIKGYPKIHINSTFAAVLSNQNIYIATNSGFGILKADSIQYFIKTPPGLLSGNSPIDMAEISPGIFLAASCNGLIKFDAHSKKADTLLNYPGNCFRTIRKIGDYYFIGTYGAGYFLYKDGVIKQMPMDKEKYLLYAHCFIPDKYGFCWISTNRGLFKAKIADIIRGFNEENPTIYYHYFGKNDGIGMTELNGGCTPCAIQLKDGTLSFPSMDGLLWVHPDTIPDILPGSDVFIDEMIIDDTTYTNNFENIVLPATTNSITIKLSYNGWGNKENIYFDYRLGKDALYKPVKIEEGAIIQLDNLPAGNYELTIRKLNGYGVDNYSYKTLNFTIEKYWFNSWWFTLLCFIVALGLVRVFLWHKTQQLEADRLRLEKQVAEKTQSLHQKNSALEKSNSLQTRLISIISHDIITPLKFMAVGGKELMEKHAIMPESLKQETIEEITNTAQELQLLSTNIMNWMKYQNENRIQVKENFNLHDATKQVTGILQSIAKQKNLILLNTIPANLHIFQFYEPLKILLYNLLSNAINFSNRGEITIGAMLVGDYIRLTVEDKGAGMTQEQIKNILSDEFIISSANIDNRKGNGLGYLIIKDLLKMIDGKIAIESKKGIGTKVSVTFSFSQST
jgi:signal transduction histidine kinase